MSGLTGNPFKGLQSYSRDDRERLFGRDKDSILMKDRIFSARTTLLFAGSGVGKTSFLNAKIIPELEGQYRIFYHNRWAGPSKPLDAVKHTLAEKLDAAKKAGPLLGIFEEFSETKALSVAHPPDDGNGASAPSAPRQCLLIFDQFEEIFQYHAYEDYFKLFLDELCEVIRREEYRVHVIFSMREEFLGELSVFDNLIPDLFNNYYRLKYPDTRDARRIIEGTCDLADTPVNKDGVAELISDLSKIEKGAAGAVERSTRHAKAADHVVERNFIIPPYLQIACHRHWEGQAEKAAGDGGGFVFLEDYKHGQAQNTLRDFCQEKLSSLTRMEQNLAAQSFDFLVTKQGAKMAYEFTSLVEHMRIRLFKGKLKSALEKLSGFETRILRKSYGPDGSLWFELYHDIYGKILDTWKQSFRRRKHRAAFGLGLATLAALLVVILLTLHWVWYPYTYKQILRNAELAKSHDGYVAAKTAYTNLSNTFGYKADADLLWAEAWDKRALYAQSHNKRDEAVISWLTALKYQPTGQAADARRHKLGGLLGGNYRGLLASLHHDNTVTGATFSDDGRILVTKTSDQKIWIWDGRTGKQIAEYSDVNSVLSASAAKSQGGAAAGGRPGSSGRDDAKPNGGSRPQGYRIKAVGFNRELGWLVALSSEEDYRRFEALMEEGGYEKTVPYNLPVTILSSTGEAVGPAITVELKGSDAEESEDTITFSPDGKLIAATGRGQSTHVWRLVGGKYVPSTGFKTSGDVSGVKFSPDGRSLLLETTGDFVSVWDTDTESPRRSPIFLPAFSNSRFMPDGSRFVTETLGSSDTPATVQMWDTATGILVGTRVTSKDTIPGVLTVGTDGSVMFLDDEDGSIRFVDLEKGELQESFRLNAKEGDQTFSFGPDGAVGIAYKDKEARLFKVERQPAGGVTLATEGAISQSVLSKDGAHVTTLSLPLSATGATPTSELTLRTGQVWDAQTARPAGAAVSGALIMSDDGEFAAEREAVKNEKGKSEEKIEQERINKPVRVLDMKTGNEVARFTYPEAEMFGEFIPAASANFFAIVSGAEDDSIAFRRFMLSMTRPNSVNSAEAKEIYLWNRHDLSEPVLSKETLQYHSKRAVTFSLDGKFFAYSTNESERVMVWGLEPWRQIQLKNNLEKASVLAFNRRGQLLAGGDKKARVWDLNACQTSCQQIYNDLDIDTQFASAALGDDGKTVLTGDSNGTVSLWKVTDKGVLARAGEGTKHDEHMWSVEFSEDGGAGIVVAGDWLHVLNLTTNAYDASYYLGNNWLHECRSLSADGSRLRCLMQPQDNSLQVVDLQSGNISGAAAVEGDPAGLFELWSGRLGLRIKDDGEIAPYLGGDTASSPDNAGK